MPPPLDEATRERLFFAWVANPNITHLSQNFNLTRVTVRRWKRLDRWEERRDVARQEFVRNGMLSLEGLAQEYERLCAALLQEFATRVESGDVEVANVGELLTLAKTQLMLRGEPTERVGLHYTLESGIPIEQASREELDGEAQRLAHRIAAYQRRLEIPDMKVADAVVIESPAGDNGTKTPKGPVVTPDPQVTKGAGTASYGDLTPGWNGTEAAENETRPEEGKGPPDAEGPTGPAPLPV